MILLSRRGSKALPGKLYLKQRVQIKMGLTTEKIQLGSEYRSFVTDNDTLADPTFTSVTNLSSSTEQEQENSINIYLTGYLNADREWPNLDEQMSATTQNFLTTSNMQKRLISNNIDKLNEVSVALAKNQETLLSLASQIIDKSGVDVVHVPQNFYQLVAIELITKYKFHSERVLDILSQIEHVQSITNRNDKLHYLVKLIRNELVDITRF
jgi:hypothetical protein